MTQQIPAPANEADARIPRALEIVKRNMLWSAGAGVLPMPVVELVAISAVEVKLIKELADHYQLQFRPELARAAVASLVGSLGSVALGKMVVYSGLRAVPILGQAIAVAAVPGIAAAVTYAIGRVFISHFEAGGTLLDFDPAKMREHFRAHYADGLSQGAATAAETRAAKPARA